DLGVERLGAVRCHQDVMHVSTAALDACANVPDVRNEPTRTDMTRHAGRSDVAEDPIVLTVIALIDLPPIRRKPREHCPALDELIAGMRAPDDLFERIRFQGNSKLAAISAADVEQRVAARRRDEVER